MYMRVKGQRARPGVEYAGHTDMTANMLGIGGAIDQGLGRGCEHKAVTDFLVGSHAAAELRWQSECDQIICGRQQSGGLCVEPMLGEIMLACRAVPVTA